MLMDTLLLFALVAGTLIGVAFGALIGCVVMHDVDEEYYRNKQDEHPGGD